MSEILSYYSHLSFLEVLAVLTGLAYVIFAAKESVWCWPMALASTALYTYIFYDVYLWMDSILQVYYFFMAMYGWYCWQERNLDDGVTIHVKAISFHLKALAALTLLSIWLGYFMDNYTPTTFPYIDAATTVFAIFTTYLVTQKALENWLYWVVIDLVSVYIYIEKGLQPTAFLFAVYVLIAAIGFVSWQQKAKHQTEPAYE